ncbi:LysR family transcriptional regulator [Leifsonia sp. L25]|uniref:LysR family transcriptional regulator n=1 Tax=Actinomycetes TaxID=1760 RepID=UPI003D69D5C0
MDIAGLRLLVAVASTGSISAAAKDAGMTQQAASLRLAALERQVGSALLVRSRRGTAPTETGELVAAWAADLLEAADRFDASVDALRQTAEETLRVAASMTIAEHLAPRWLTSLGTGGAGPRVELTAANSETVLTAVRDATAAIGFIETPDVPADLASVEFASDELVVVVGRSHPWAGRARGVSVQELARTPLIARERGSGTRLAFERALAEAGHPPVRPALELSSTSAIRATAATGEHPAVLSILAVREQVASGLLVKVPIRQLRIVRPLTAVWRRSGAGVSGNARALLELVQSIS